jgi:hypothetical protein
MSGKNSTIIRRMRTPGGRAEAFYAAEIATDIESVFT